MNGAVYALETAREAGVDLCFANPGTTEMDLVAALDTVSGVRSVLCLFEGVVTGAADGYARMAGKPALTLTHLGPGFANGIANLHNASRAGSPIVNLIGDHASWHLAADAPLTSDIESLARPVSRFVRRVASAADMGPDILDAISAAMGPPSGVASLIVPQDAAWGEVDARARAAVPTARAVDRGAIERAAERLRRDGERSAVLLGGRLSKRALDAAAAVGQATGCRVLIDAFPARVPQGRGVPAFDVVPYFPEQALEELGTLSSMVLAGTRAPVAFFGYRRVGKSQLLPEGCATIGLSGPGEPMEPELVALAEALDATPVMAEAREPVAAVPDGPLDVMSLGGVIAAEMPEGTIVVNEAATSGFGFMLHARNAAPHDVLHLTGGAIGQGLPTAVGAAIAAPDRPVIAFQADGSAMYTLQSLWTMAREQLNVTVVLCSNRAYRILQVELGRTGNAEPGPNAMSLTDLSNPEIDWVSLAQGMGVPARRATTTTELATALGACKEPGPSLIEAIV